MVSTIPLPMLSPSSISIIGPTMSGKTSFIFRYLKNIKAMYQVNEHPVQIMYCFGADQPLFREMELAIPNIFFHQGLPTESELNDFAENGVHKLVVMDDLAQEIINRADMEILFTQKMHHMNLSLITVYHNLFHQGKYARNISLNTTYLVLFRNLRDSSQIVYLGHQLFPGRKGHLLQAYEDATRERGYLLIDLSPIIVDERLRLRTNIFSDEDLVVYVSTENNRAAFH